MLFSVWDERRLWSTNSDGLGHVSACFIRDMRTSREYILYKMYIVREVSAKEYWIGWKGTRAL
jgi:hypothetical protein